MTDDLTDDMPPFTGTKEWYEQFLDRLKIPCVHDFSPKQPNTREHMQKALQAIFSLCYHDEQIELLAEAVRFRREHMSMALTWPEWQAMYERNKREHRCSQWEKVKEG